MKPPVGISEATWAGLTDHERWCVSTVLAEDAAYAAGKWQDVWPAGWTGRQVIESRREARRILDPRLGCGR